MDITYWTTLAVLLLSQVAVGLFAWRHAARRLRCRRLLADTRADRPFSESAAILAALQRIETRLEHARSAPPAWPTIQPGEHAYRLARQMADSGVPAAEIAHASGIDLHEAALLQHLREHAPRPRLRAAS